MKCKGCYGSGWVGINKTEIDIEGLFMRKCCVCKGSGIQPEKYRLFKEPDDVPSKD